MEDKRYEKPAYLRFDLDEDCYECSKCGAQFSECSWGIADWGWCPVCGEPLRWVDDPERERDFLDERYRARVREVEGHPCLQMASWTLGGAR